MAQLEILVVGPASQEQAARQTLMRAGVSADQFVPAHHGYHHDQDAYDPSEAWIAYRADTLEAAETDALRTVGWRLRIHRHAERLPVQPAVQPPAVDPLDEMRAEIARLSAEVRALRGGG